MMMADGNCSQGGIRLKKQGKRDLCNGPVLSGMFMYSLPLVATGILQVLYNAADTVVIGQFAGDESLSAVASTGAFVNLLVNLFMGLSAGILTVVSQHIGAQSREKIHKSVHTAIPLALLCGAFLLVVGVLIAEPVLRFMGTGDEGTSVLSKAVLYTRIYFLGTPGFLLYNFGSSILRAAGDTKRPMIALTISGILNVLLNLLLVIVFHMDVAGVAIATIVSQYVSAILVMIFLLREQSDIRFEFSKMHIYRSELFEILHIGIPSSIQSSMFSVSNVLMQSTANTFSDMHIAGAGASGQLTNLMYTIVTAYYTTTLAFTGQNFGARKVHRIKKVLKNGHLLSLVTCIGVSSLLLVFHKPLLQLFTSSPQALEAGATHLFLLAGFVFIDGALNIQVAHLRGLGVSIIPMINSVVGVCGFRLLWIYIFFPLLGSTWFALYLCYPLNWALVFFAHLTYSIFVDCRLLKKFKNEKQPELKEVASV